jgi:hypothetical protein
VSNKLTFVTDGNMSDDTYATLYRWEQELCWRDDAPQALTKDGPFTPREEQIKFLEKEAQRYFEARICVGMLGSYRPRTVPIAGSLMWSLLFKGKSESLSELACADAVSGQRLIVLYGPQSSYRHAIAVVQQVGDLM